MTKTLFLKRVAYGKASTPLAEREYTAGAGSPVGTLADWSKFAQQKGFNYVEYTDNGIVGMLVVGGN